MQLRYGFPLELDRIGGNGLLSSATAAIYLEPPGSIRHFVRYAPAYIDDPAGRGLFQGLAADQYLSPPAYTLALPDAMAFGYRALAWDGQFCVDELPAHPDAHQGFLAHIGSGKPLFGEDTGLQPTVEPGVFELPIATSDIRRVAQSVVSLCSHEPSNYGSFLFRVMTKLATIEQLGLDALNLLVWAHPSIFQQYLAIAGIATDRIIQHDTHSPTQYDRVIAPSLRNPHGFLDPQSVSFFRRIAARYAGPGLGPFLYISRMGQARRGASTRQMVNEPEVAEMAARLGFTVMEPEAYTPEQQIAAFANARIIAGPSGSAMFNCVFCREGTKVVDIESEPHWIYAHTGLFASCALDYGLVVGITDPADSTPVHKPFHVDVTALASRLQQLQQSENSF